MLGENGGKHARDSVLNYWASEHAPSFSNEGLSIIGKIIGKEFGRNVATGSPKPRGAATSCLTLF